MTYFQILHNCAFPPTFCDAAVDVFSINLAAFPQNQKFILTFAFNLHKF